MDYFLFLNHFCRPSRIEATRQSNGDTVVLVDLHNDASLSLVLTEHGSSRLGVREVVHLTVGTRTATLIDDFRYEAESHSRSVRKTSLGKLTSFRRMYDTIGRRIGSRSFGWIPMRSSRFTTRRV